MRSYLGNVQGQPVGQQVCVLAAMLPSHERPQTAHTLGKEIQPRRGDTREGPRTSDMMAMLLGHAHVCTRPLKNMSAAYAYARWSSDPALPLAWLDDPGMAGVYMMIDSCARAHTASEDNAHLCRHQLAAAQLECMHRCTRTLCTTSRQLPLRTT